MRPPRETLEKLYVTERLTTRAIGARFGISKTGVLRWIKHYGMTRRGVGRGLVARGLTPPPDAATLHSLLHIQHWSWGQIGTHYGVDQSAIDYWIKKHKVRRKTRSECHQKGRVPPSADDLRHLYSVGHSLERIAEMHGAGFNTVRLLASHIGLAVRPNGWNPSRRWSCDDGHAVRSSLEMRVDNWLNANGIEHHIEPRIPRARWRADFWTADWFIEVWGIKNRPSYRRRQQEKREHCRQHNIPLLELSLHDFSSHSPDLWSQKLAATFCAAPWDSAPRAIPA